MPRARMENLQDFYKIWETENIITHKREGATIDHSSEQLGIVSEFKFGEGATEYPFETAGQMRRRLPTRGNRKTTNERLPNHIKITLIGGSI